MPKEEKPEKSCMNHKLMMGAGIILFSLVLYITSSEAAIQANLNWSGAFFVIGMLYIVKALLCLMKKK
jgi:hypothetical protein